MKLINLLESYVFDENLILDIAIEGAVGYFLDGSEEHGVLNLERFRFKHIYVFRLEYRRIRWLNAI